jgi:hypothetical protein
VLERLAREQAAARRALDEALLDEKRLDDFLDGVARLGKRRRDGLDAHRPAAETFRDEAHVAPIELVEAHGVNLKAAERLVGFLGVDGGNTVDDGEIADAAQEPRGDARRAARGAGDLGSAVRRQVDAEDAGPSPMMRSSW